MSRAPSASPYRAVHLFGLWSLVVAQPLYDVLRRNGEFFVAHRASRLDLLLLVGTISVLVPGILALLVRGVAAASIRAGRVLHVVLVGALVAALASEALARVSSMSVAAHVAGAVAVGVLAAWAYARAAPARLAVSMLGLSVPVSAAVFLLHPDMAPFVWPHDPSRDAAALVPAGAPPIVMVVFDQFPVSSLMLPDGAVDGARYPSFARLAETSTWFRNATSNAELTGWAVPALLSGNLPRRARLPITAHHPQNVFTVLGGTYRMQVTEPITQLCPERLCPTEAGRRAERLTAMSLDAAVVYLHVVVPRNLRSSLPSLTNDWKDFRKAQHWQRRWVSQRVSDRRQPTMQFMDSIHRSDPQPTLYYLHVLLPHEPFIYTRTGQQFTTEIALPGLTRLDLWISEEWPVVQAYQRHLLQVEYADALVGQLLQRLTSEGLFDRSIVVITADHGASFRPGHPFRGIDRVTVADIAPVPLFVKEPGQRAGRVDDRNIQAIDFLPTLASRLHAQLRSPVDGIAAVEGASLPARKVFRHMGGAREMAIESAALASGRMESVARRWSLFEGSVSPVPSGAARVLLGRPVPAASADPVGAPLEVLLRDRRALQHVDVSASVLPLRLEGRLRDREGRPASSTLAVAVNGTIRAVTRTLDRLEPGTWTAQLEPGDLRDGSNDIKVFLVSGDGTQLTLVYPVGLRPPSLNLASETAATYWSVRQSGLSPPQSAKVSFRWTDPDVSITVPLEAAERARALRIGLTGPPPSGARVRLHVNDCALFDGPVSSSPWYHTFSLDGCPALRAATEAHIVIRTIGGAAAVPQGVSLETLNLFPAPWPPPPPGPDDLRAAVQIVGEAREKVAHAEPLVVNVRNRGSIAWADSAAEPDWSGNTALQFRWRSLSSGAEDRSQRLRLPRVLHPGDTVEAEVPLVPPAALDRLGPWELAIVPVTDRGTEIPLDAPCTVRVLATPGHTSE